MEFIDPRILGLAIAIGLGLLVGMQREWVADKPIGLRSFALIGTIGGLIGLFAMEYGAWILASGLIAVTIAIYSHAYFLSRHIKVSGMTTELAAIAMFLVGALATSGYMAVAVVLGGVITLLLHWKDPMHTWVERIGEFEFQAIARFVLISLVVLPILPNKAYGPYSVLNPWQIWLMVVLIVSINLAAYVSMKVSSGKGGVLLSGVLGGLISSTATTVSFSGRSRGDRSVVPIAGIVILVASALVYFRIVIETAVVARDLLPELLGPVVAFLALFAVVIGVLLIRQPQTAGEDQETSNPAELKTALSFGLLYCLVLFISAAVTEQFGESMLYPIAAISGLTDVDAITLSIGRLFVESRIDTDIAWRVIFVASLSNLAFKAGVVAVIGGAHLRRRLVPVLVSLTLIGFLGVWLWP
jgi:uncharacterized membrane protein (DUF4010 family)